MSKLFIVLGVVGIGVFSAGDVAAQCARQRGSEGGTQRAASFSPSIQLSGIPIRLQGGQQGGQLLTGPGSYFHDLMMQNAMRQQYARQQAYIATMKQAKRNTRKQSQLDTRRKQREAELARREEQKRRAQQLAKLQTATTTAVSLERP